MCTKTATSLHEELPRALTPLRYALHCFDITNETFSGELAVQFKCNSAVDSIQLNQKLLNCKEAWVTQSGKKSPVVSITKDDKAQTVTFELSKSLDPENEVSLLIKYEGVIRKDMAGFYSSTYENDQGETEYLLTTQFESTDARSAFPCYDEPNAKAIFDIKITVAKDQQVLSNMPIRSTTDVNESVCFEFDSSPKMSTYLVAWAIGKFEFIETIHTHKDITMPIRVYTIPGQSHLGQYALQVASKAIDNLSTIFDLDYPLPKLDLLAVPQFGANAMENWGLVMFRSTALLFDEKTSNKVYQKQVAYVVCHELAHSWFGNLVTMDWWSDLWLNESFATYVGWYAVDRIHPEWEVFTEFVSNAVQQSLNLDGLKNSHPIEVGVYYASDIDEIFDAISYLKGGSVVRMVAESVGVELFLKGVSQYLKKFQYGNARSDDLWDAISEVSGKPITQLVEPWIRQVGHPYLKASKNGDNEVAVSQQRFLSNGQVQPEDDETVWWIPNVNNMQSKTTTLQLDGFVKLNKNTSGFYRCHYDEELFQNLLNHMQELTSMDKIGLIGDTCAMAQAQIGNTSDFLKLLKQLKTEEDFPVWLEMSKRLSSLQKVFDSDSEISSKLNQFSQELYETKFNEIFGKQEENQVVDFNLIKLKSLIFKQAGMSGLPAAINKAKELYISGNIDPILKGTVYKILLRHDPTRKIFDEVMREIFKPTSIDGREAGLDAVGSVGSDDLLPEVLELLINGKIPEMDYRFLTVSLSSNAKAKEQFWEFVKLNFDDKIHKNTSLWTLDRVIKNFLPNLVSAQLLEDVTNFFAKRDTKGYSKGVAQSLDSISTDVAWYEGSKEELKKFFEN